MSYKRGYKKKGGKLEYKTYRVRGHIKSFRDLEIYKQTTLLATQLVSIELPPKLKNRKIINNELEQVIEYSKEIPKLIAKSYGMKYVDKNKAYLLIESAAQGISEVVTKIDFVITLTTDVSLKQGLVKIIDKYQKQRRKVINLKRAWIRIEEKFKTKNKK